MKRAALIVALVLAITLLLVWLLRPERQFTNYPPRATGPWVAFGDSLTEGYGATAGKNYPAVLGERLGVSISNLGKSGETSTDALNRIDDVARLQPRVVLLCFGGNDSLQGQPASRTFDNLAQIIDRLHSEGAFVVLIGIRTASLRDKNQAHFSKLARDKNVLYVPDMLKGLAFKPVYMSDAIHPNDAGYARIAERLEDVLKPMLPKLAN